MVARRAGRLTWFLRKATASSLETRLVCHVLSLRFRDLVCHAVDTASLATWYLFGKLFCVAALFDFGEKRCRKNLPLADAGAMKRKLLLDHANTLCQMLYSRRLERDRDMLIALPAGTVTVDVLTGAASHDTAGHLDTAFGGDFADWFREKRDDAGIPDDYIVSATLTIAIDPTRPHPSD